MTNKIHKLFKQVGALRDLIESEMYGETKPFVKFVQSHFEKGWKPLVQKRSGELKEGYEPYITTSNPYIYGYPSKDNISTNWFREDGTAPFKKEGLYSEYKRVVYANSDDIIFPVDGTFGFFMSGIEGVLGSTWMRIDTYGADKWFLCACLAFGWASVDKRAYGTGLQHLPAQDLLNILIYSHHNTEAQEYIGRLYKDILLTNHKLATAIRESKKNNALHFTF